MLYTNGFLGARRPSEAARLVAQAAARVASCVHWRSGYPFLSEQELLVGVKGCVTSSCPQNRGAYPHSLACCASWLPA
jgi:hypothetical protein